MARAGITGVNGRYANVLFMRLENKMDFKNRPSHRSIITVRTGSLVE